MQASNDTLENDSSKIANRFLYKFQTYFTTNDGNLP